MVSFDSQPVKVLWSFETTREGYHGHWALVVKRGSISIQAILISFGVLRKSLSDVLHRLAIIRLEV